VWRWAFGLALGAVLGRSTGITADRAGQHWRHTRRPLGEKLGPSLEGCRSGDRWVGTGAHHWVIHWVQYLATGLVHYWE
jgi:hypothetical protein